MVDGAESFPGLRQREKFFDQAIHVIEGPFDIGQMIALTVFFRELEAALGNRQGVSEVMGNQSGELRESVVPFGQFAFALPESFGPRHRFERGSDVLGQKDTKQEIVVVERIDDWGPNQQSSLSPSGR